VAQVVADLVISEQTIYVWRRQYLIDTGQLRGATSSENAELVAGPPRIAELEAEVAIHRPAAQLLGEVVSPKDASRRSCSTCTPVASWAGGSTPPRPPHWPSMH
jgi:transposase